MATTLPATGAAGTRTDGRHPGLSLVTDSGAAAGLLNAGRQVGASITPARRPRFQRTFLLQRAQPALTGLIDGSLSTLAPIFAVALATHQPRFAFLAGLATAIGAGVSMAFSEGLSDTGDLTGRGRPFLRGAITGAGTLLGGVLHTLPFLIPDYHAAVLLALAVIAAELLVLAWIRRLFFATGFLSSFVSVTLGGAIIAGVSAALGAFS